MIEIKFSFLIIIKILILEAGSAIGVGAYFFPCVFI
jgi:hypothetical protein